MRVLLLGAGVQSSCIAEMSFAGVIEPMDMIIFADTGNEPAKIYEHVHYLKQKTPPETKFIVTKKEGTKGITEDFLSDTRFASMPLYTIDANGKKGILRRQCTNEYKIEPCQNEILDELVLRGMAKYDSIGRRRVSVGTIVQMVYGISAEEGYRVKQREITRWQKSVYPLVDMRLNRSGCLNWLETRGLRLPTKSSCIVCPYHNDEYWMSLTAEEFESACLFDEKIRDMRSRSGIKDKVFLHSSRTPLRTAIKQARRQTNMFAVEALNECRTDGGFTCFS